MNYAAHCYNSLLFKGKKSAINGHIYKHYIASFVSSSHFIVKNFLQSSYLNSSFVTS